MKKQVYLVVLILVGLFVVLYTLNWFFPTNQQHSEDSSEYTSSDSNPPIKTSLKDIVYLDWDMNLYEISELFPGGKLKRGDVKSRTAALYAINVELLDINRSDTVSFHQDEESLRNQSRPHLALRMIELENPSEEVQESEFDRICRYIKTLRPKVVSDIDNESRRAKFRIFDLDRKDGIAIDVEARQFKNWLRIEIQPMRGLRSVDKAENT